MTMNLDMVGWASEPVARSWASDEAILYALGVGAGSVEPHARELEFTTDNSADVQQRVLPTFATVIGQGAAVATRLGTFDRARLVHGEQSVRVHGPIPVAGSVETRTTVKGIYDKGSGALAVLDAASLDPVSGATCFATTTSLFVRGEGGFGGHRAPADAGPPPAREPDKVVTYLTRPDQALLYRLTGDRNPLHSDPAFAASSGFHRPILHGLCTFGFVGRALLHAVCDSQVERFSEMSTRFSRPTYPGDALRVSMWIEGDDCVIFRTDNQRGEAVLEGGVFKLAS
jgi:acyl dehydratase